MLCFCTDNSTVKGAIYKGTSTNKELLKIVIEFFDLQFEYGFNAIVTHVAGTRMIAQGGDGLSRGATNEGVMNGENYLLFIPFHLSAIDCSPQIKEWLISWASNQKLTFLTPDDWFQKGHNIIGWKEELDRPGNKLWKPIIKHNTYVWSPPPAVADVAVEELRKAHLKRHKSTHIIIIPKLLTLYWRKILYGDRNNGRPPQRD